MEKTHASSIKLCFTRPIITTHKSWIFSCQKHGMQHFLIVELARLFVVMNGLARTSNKYNTVKVIRCTGLETERKSKRHSSKISALIGNNYITIQTDVIENNIPLFLSKLSMKKTEMIVNFQNDIANVFRQKIPLISTSSGYKRNTISNGQTNHHKTTLPSNIKRHFNSHWH